MAMEQTNTGKKTMKQSIRNIIFDLGGVLVDLDSRSCIEAFEQIGARHVATYVREHRTADLFLDIELGHMTQAEFCNEVRRIGRCQAEDTDIVWAWNQLLTQIADEKKQRLIDLRQHYRLFLLSNTNRMHWHKCVDELFAYGHFGVDDYFEQVFLSYEMHLAKPDRAIYEQVLNQAQLQPAETLFIDDTEVNCLAADRIGIRTLQETTGRDWLNKTSEHR